MRRASITLLVLGLAILLVGLFIHVVSIPSEEEVRQAMDKTIIPDFSCDEVAVGDVMQSVLDRLKVADPRMARVRLDFHLMNGDPQLARMTFREQNISAEKAMRYASYASNHRYVVRRGAIYIVSFSYGGPITPLEEAGLAFHQWWRRAVNIFR